MDLLGGSSSEVEEVAERTLCQLPNVHVFKIPPQGTAEGHRAADWPRQPSWTGKCKIVARGREAAVILMDKDTNGVFASAQDSIPANSRRSLSCMMSAYRSAYQLL